MRDSEIALRDLSAVRSTALIVQVRARVSASGGNSVDLLVVTRDLLSLRPSFNFEGSVDLITNFMVSLGESNVLGYNKSVSAIYDMQQGQHIFALNYFDPRLFGSPLQLALKPSLVMLREPFRYDGFAGEFKLEKPLYSEQDFFGYGAGNYLRHPFRDRFCRQCGAHA